MQDVANTLTVVSGCRQLADDELVQVCAGFNPQPDPPARHEIPSNTPTLMPSNTFVSKGY
jgi:hypothetical protein